MVTCRRAALWPRSAQGRARLSHSVSAIGALGMRTGDAAAGCARRFTQTCTANIRCTSGNTVVLGLFLWLMDLGGTARAGGRGCAKTWVGAAQIRFSLTTT